MIVVTVLARQCDLNLVISGAICQAYSLEWIYFWDWLFYNIFDKDWVIFKVYVLLENFDIPLFRTNTNDLIKIIYSSFIFFANSQGRYFERGISIFNLKVNVFAEFLESIKLSIVVVSVIGCLELNIGDKVGICVLYVISDDMIFHCCESCFIVCSPTSVKPILVAQEALEILKIREFLIGDVMIKKNHSGFSGTRV